jgi:hypothetical protein
MNTEEKEALIELGVGCAWDPEGPTDEKGAKRLVSFVTSLLEKEREKLRASLEELPIGVTPDNQSFILRDAVLAILTLQSNNKEEV